MTISDDALRAAQAVNAERLWGRLMRMAEFGARPDGGVDRPCLSAEDQNARAELIGWAEARGYQVSVDRAANLFIRRAGRRDGPAILTGSHMDSQPKGGRFDGIGGVLGGLEALDAISEAGLETDRAIEVVAFTNEEGGRFSPGCTGSMSWSGARDPASFDDLEDENGVRYADALNETLSKAPELATRPLGDAPAAYVELHIEQGPVLEEKALQIAAVTGIQGVRWYDVEITGDTAHAGTTPLALRRDAVQAMHRAIAALNALMADPDDVVRFTVGRIEVEPNSPNAVADKARFTIDFRHPDRAVLEQRGNAVEEAVRKAAEPCRAEVRPSLFSDPTHFPEPIVAIIEQAARDLDFGVMRLPSGAFHDALFASQICPTAMIFVPSRNGLSHHPDEYTAPEHMAAGTQVLAATLVDLANGNATV